MFQVYAEQGNLKDYTFQATVARTGQVIDTSASYTMRSDNHIAQLFGKDFYTASGQTQSTSSLPNYVDVYFAMDVSQSMGLGASQTDMTALFRKTGCVFGCHVPADGQSVSNQAVAKANNIDLRIDVLRRAVKKMIKTAEADAGQSVIYRFGLYTMGAHPSYVNEPFWDEPHLGELTPINGNFAALQAKANGIDLGPNDRRGQGDSYFRQPLEKFVPIIPTAGDGSSREKARAFLFIVTDGARDVANASGVGCASGSYGNHCMGVMDPRYCQSFKNKNVTVGVLYTTFLPVYANPGNVNDKTLEGNYVNLLINNGLAPQIAPMLQQCASPGWFYEASDTTGIDAAMKDMFEQITNTPALIR